MKTYYPTINLLRVIATFGICLIHFIGYSDFRGYLFFDENVNSQFTHHGTSIVYIFFLISGFVIPLSLLKDDIKLVQPQKFLLRRFLRIELPYIISILLILFVSLIFAVKNNQDFTVNTQQFVYHILYLIPFSSHIWYNPIYWTLALEFQFYLIVVLLYYGITSERKWIVYLTLILFGITGFLVTDNRLIFHYSVIFLQGIILLMFKTKRIETKPGIVLIILCIVSTAYLHSIEIALILAISLCLIMLIEIDNKTINRLSELSYSLYLIHGLIGGNILYLFSSYITSYPGKIVLVILSLSVSLVFSYIYWWLIERPSRKLSRKINVA